jgi:hypothetical protein
MSTSKNYDIGTVHMRKTPIRYRPTSRGSSRMVVFRCASMKIPMFLIGVMILAGFLSGCEEEAQVSLVPRNYSSWGSTVDEVLEYQIPGHTQALRKIYINRIGTTVTPQDMEGRVTYDYPEGTVLLKENYTNADDATPNNITVMIKDAKNPDAKGGWVWINKNVASGGERIFSNEFCFSCHQNANERHPYGDRNSRREFRDYVYYPWNSETGT